MTILKEDAIMCDDWKELHEDLLVEILLKMSVKSLIRCIFKTWRDLIKSTQLFAMHFEFDKRRNGPYPQMCAEREPMCDLFATKWGFSWSSIKKRENFIF